MSDSHLEPLRRTVTRNKSSFLARTATDNAAQLNRRFSMASGPPEHAADHQSEPVDNPYEPVTTGSEPAPRPHHLTRRLLGIFGFQDGSINSTGSPSRFGRHASHAVLGQDSLTAQMHQLDGSKHENASRKPKPGSLPRPVGGHDKLGTFSGVFVPTTLNVLSILMFLRFGFILGQSGVVGMLGMLIASYLINLVTTLSISAIATNGTVRGGGAYYLISRSLGPEFGGSIGIVFYLGFVFNTGLNAVGLVDCFKQNFGSLTGNWAQWLPEGNWWQYLWATVVLLICTGICLAGSGLFARCSNGLLVLLLLATFSIPFSTFIVKPFKSSMTGIEYTGLSRKTLMGNLLPKFTRGAAGSQLKGKENYQDLFGILFPATGGIFAGASMSGDLQNPSRSIPRGTLHGLLLTFITYTIVILALAATVTRASLYRDANIMQDINISGPLVLIGEFATSAFSCLMGVIGSAKLLQALARDNLIPGFSIFGQGTKQKDEPTVAIIITYIVAQITMLCDINQIASFVTMTYLMTFLVTNLACFLLKASSAPNFRPSFHYFNMWTAAAGTLSSGATMFFVDGLYASGCVVILIVIFLIIHYTSPPKSWGDVSQALIYHQVRKYLLRLRQEHVKFWRPQILLFINDPRRQYKLIQFCNSLKKGALFVLGHVIVTSDFGAAVPEARRQQAAWTKYIDFSKVKAFVNIAISPAVEWGARNIVMSSGLGGMRPNIVVMGFYNLDEYRKTQPLVDVPSAQPSRQPSRRASPVRLTPDGKTQRRKTREDLLHGLLPTDSCRTEGAVKPTSYVMILEDLLLRVQINVAVAKGFQQLELPRYREDHTKKYIDLWPIQMSAEIAAEGGDHKQNVLTTNFDTYTLILQLGCILNTVPAWKKTYKLRVAVFVEYESDVEEERGRVKTLLDNLRIEAEVLVFWLACGDLPTYEIIVNGNSSGDVSEIVGDVNEVLRQEEWWSEIQRIRGREEDLTASQQLAEVEGFLQGTTNWPSSTMQHGRREGPVERFEELRALIGRHKRRRTITGLTNLGLGLGMRTHRLEPDLFDHNAMYGSASEDSDDSDESDIDVFGAHDNASEGAVSPASENAMDDYEIAGEEPTPPLSPAKILRRRSHGDSLQGPRHLKRSSSRPPAHTHGASTTISAAHDKGQDPTSDPAIPIPPSALAGALRQATPVSSETAPPATSPPEQGPPKGPTDRIIQALKQEHQPGPSSSRSAPASGVSTPKAKPPIIRQSSIPKFTSKPVPMTKVASEEDGPGPSIMFADTSPPPREEEDGRGRSIYDRSNISAGHTDQDASTPTPAQDTGSGPPGSADGSSTGSTGKPASGFPAQQAIPLSFNDLPCRAQHLILNDLIRRQSEETAVVFTTLPSPVEGTYKSEADSLGYLGDLEVLCQGLPPVLLVHSNSMTVTMNL
ncbi:hypothetical protein L228DRAFT_281783 [Xylona heveae TC161]|uniref:Cation chloride cotransporter n=1 Tax=Xylona heveae (strain CBS 132557 / TC161) TaxID=1328760 RepID=A0A165IDE7_XYLHT|nr:hypothetical protein L228DRAFT_281783 [Xylona heveae TC161]KZF24739.1 hypothetical protein L228DRAFT_281783 [Xylona heveae TC161]